MLLLLRQEPEGGQEGGNAAPALEVTEKIPKYELPFFGAEDGFVLLSNIDVGGHGASNNGASNDGDEEDPSDTTDSETTEGEQDLG